MKNILQLCTLFSLVIFAFTFSYANCKPTTITKLNKDNSALRIVKKCNKTDRHITIYFLQSRKSKPKQVLNLVQNLEEMPSGGAGFVDIDKDGFYEIEVQGMCGAGPNCEGDLYKLDRVSNSIYHFFNGGYESIFMLDGYLIESGRNGCCAWEYHAYKIGNNKQLLTDENMEMMIEVKAEGDDKGNVTSVNCTFSRSDKGDFKIINPPSKKWLKLCEQYDKNYTVVRPE